MPNEKVFCPTPNESNENLIKNLINTIFDTSVNEKEFGCERCSTCTESIAKELNNWIDKNPDGLDILAVNLNTFATFPRALQIIIKGCLNVAKRDAKNTESFLPHIVQLIEFAKESYKDNNYLVFSRIVTVLDNLSKDMENILEPMQLWQPIHQQINSITRQATLLEKSFLKTDKFSRTFRVQSDKSSATDGKRHKRVCGGGFFQYDDEKIYTLDISPFHFLGITANKHDVLNQNMDHNKYSGVFVPCQRELPFNAIIQPERRKYEEDCPMVRDQYLGEQCGKYYQLFSISHISHRYYYFSMIYHKKSNLSSENHDFNNFKLIKTNSWPVTEISQKISLTNVESLVEDS